MPRVNAIMHKADGLFKYLNQHVWVLCLFRCLLTTVDPAKGVRRDDGEQLKTLQRLVYQLNIFQLIMIRNFLSQRRFSSSLVCGTIGLKSLWKIENLDAYFHMIELTIMKCV